MAIPQYAEKSARNFEVVDLLIALVDVRGHNHRTLVGDWWEYFSWRSYLVRLNDDDVRTQLRSSAGPDFTARLPFLSIQQDSRFRRIFTCIVGQSEYIRHT